MRGRTTEFESPAHDHATEQRMNARLGYLVPEFPAQTHVLFWREVCALREMGEQVFVLSTRLPSPITCHHDFVSQAVAETHYVFPPGVSYVATWLAGGCTGLWRASAYLRGLESSGLKARVRQSA